MAVIIKNGTIVTDTDTFESDILVENDIITKIEKNIECSDAQVIDAKGRYIFPGFIDTHTHFDMFTGSAQTADDFYSGTKAALVGGTTTIMNFASHHRGETLQHAVDDFFRKADGKSSCDYAFHLELAQWNDEIKSQIDSMFEIGITSFKMYMAYPAIKVDDGMLYNALKYIHSKGGIIGVHCENGDLADALAAELLANGVTSPAGHPLARNSRVESEAISRLLTIAKQAEVPVNIVHLSSKEGLAEIEKARANGVECFVETCPQYLTLDDSKFLDNGEDGTTAAKYILAPPLRKQADIDKLWEALKNDEIQTVGTDHCSFNYKGLKDQFKDNFTKIPGGIPGAEHRVELMYTNGVCENKITLNQMVKYLSTNPAKLFGMYPQKGAIKVGSEADIVVWDKDFRGTITAENQLHNVDYTPYEGFEIKGKPIDVLLHGEVVVKDYKIVKELQGRFVKRNKSGVID
ncbi:MAG: dihydropyrimidinase [Oscillospiraceae bacterium]